MPTHARTPNISRVQKSIAFSCAKNRFVQSSIDVCPTNGTNYNHIERKNIERKSRVRGIRTPKIINRHRFVLI